METTIKSLFITETPTKVVLTVDRHDFNSLLKLLTHEGLNIFISRIKSADSTAVELNCTPQTYWSTLNSMDLVSAS